MRPPWGNPVRVVLAITALYLLLVLVSGTLLLAYLMGAR